MCFVSSVLPIVVLSSHLAIRNLCGQRFMRSRVSSAFCLQQKQQVWNNESYPFFNYHTSSLHNNRNDKDRILRGRKRSDRNEHQSSMCHNNVNHRGHCGRGGNEPTESILRVMMKTIPDNDPNVKCNVFLCQ